MAEGIFSDLEISEFLQSGAPNGEILIMDSDKVDCRQKEGSRQRVYPLYLQYLGIIYMYIYYMVRGATLYIIDILYDINSDKGGFN